MPTSIGTYLLYLMPLLLCGLLLVLMLALTTALRVVPETQRLSVFRLGHYLGERGPGLVILFPLIDRGVTVDVRDQLTKAQGQQQLFGALGETKTAVHHEGTVELAGTLWQATSAEPLPLGTKVRVVKVLLQVEKFD